MSTSSGRWLEDDESGVELGEVEELLKLLEVLVRSEGDSVVELFSSVEADEATGESD